MVIVTVRGNDPNHTQIMYLSEEIYGSSEELGAKTQPSTQSGRPWEFAFKEDIEIIYIYWDWGCKGYIYIYTYIYTYIYICIGIGDVCCLGFRS